MTFHFVKAAEKYGLSSLSSLVEAGADLRVLLVMTNNNAVSVRATAQFVSDITTLDEFDGSGYTAGGQVLATQTLTVDAANFRVELDAVDNVWNPLGAGTRDIAGAVVYELVTNYADSPVLAFYDDGGFPKPATGSAFTLTWSAEGLIQFDCPLS